MPDEKVWQPGSFGPILAWYFFIALIVTAELVANRPTAVAYFVHAGCKLPLLKPSNLFLLLKPFSRKCDRSLPCANCVKRDGLNTSSCSYATSTRKKGPQPAEAVATPNDMQNRIERLETLVLSLVHRSATVKQDAASGSTSASGSASAGAPNTASVASVLERPQQAGSAPEDCSDTDDCLATSLGVLKVDYDHEKFLYVDQQHWHTILSGITEVKTYFASHKKDLEQSYEKVLSSKPKKARHGPTLLLGATPASEVELRAELPPKSSVLTLCGRYFNSMDSAVNIIHAPTFHKQLQEHWEKPSETPITWLGLLYAVLCLAMVSYKSIGDEPPEWKGRTDELAAEYCLHTVQCLVTADFTKPADYTVETMILYVLAEQSWRWDAEFGLWLITSLITRIAFRMGYHRDAKWFPSLTPFQAVSNASFQYTLHAWGKGLLTWSNRR